MARRSGYRRIWVPAHEVRATSVRAAHHVKGHYRYSYQHRAALRRAEGRREHLYTNPRERRANLREFEERYGTEKGRRVFGAVVGKVRREQFREGRRGRFETVRQHESHTRYGKREHVRGHRARIA